MKVVLVPDWFLHGLLVEWKKKWCLYCSFFLVCSNLSVWYQSLKCLAVVLLWKHNTVKINSVALQRKDRRINTGSTVAITFLHSEKFLTRNRSSWMGEGNREDSISLSWNNWGLQFYLVQEMLFQKFNGKEATNKIKYLLVQNVRDYSANFIFF